MQPFALLAGLGLLFGLGAAQVHRFERLAAADISSRLGGGHREVSVTSSLASFPAEFGKVAIRASHFEANALPLFTEPERRKSGSIHDLRLELRDFRLAGLRVDSLVADIPECNFDFGLAFKSHLIRLSKSGIGVGTVRILAADLESWILRKYHEIKKVSLKVERDKIWVEGYGEFVIVKTNFTVISVLEVRDGTKLYLSNARIFLDGAVADEPARKVLLDKLNPVVDLKRDLGLFDAVSIEKLTLRDGVIEASGKTKIPIKPS